MSSQDRLFIAFAEFEPDGVEFDNPKLDIAENVTPSYGAYRPVEKLKRVASVSDTEPLTGGYAHLSGQATPNITLSPSREGFTAPPMVNNWYVKDLKKLDDVDIDNYGVDQLKGPAIDDTTWIRSPALVGATSGTLYLRFPETPRVPAAVNDNVEFKIRFRVDGDVLNQITQRIDYEILRDGGTSIKTGTWTHTTSDDVWEDFSVTLTAAEITAISDWATIEIKLVAESTASGGAVPNHNVPVTDEYYDIGWANEAAASVDMFESIDTINGAVAAPDYNTYVDSGPVPPDGESTIIFGIGSVSQPVDPDTEGQDFLAYFTADKSNVSVHMRVVQADAAADPDDTEGFWIFSGQTFKVLYDKIIDNISTDQTIPTPTILSDTPADGYDWAENADPEKVVYIAFTVIYAGDGDGGTGTAYIVPSARSGSGSGWSGSVSDIDNVSDGDESNATDAGYAITMAGGAPRAIKFDMTDGPGSTANTGHVVHVRMKGPGTLYRFEILHAGAVIKNTQWKSGLTTTEKWFTTTLSSGQAAQITDYSDVQVKVYAASDSGVFTVSEVYFEYPGDSASARIYETYVNAENGCHLDISDLRMQLVDPKNSNIGDLNEIYVGTNSNLYEATSIGFSKVTRAASDYGLGTLDDIPKLWNFTSWGDDVIATNYADVVQRRVHGDTLFTDLITSIEKPQARFAAVIAAQLVLADINPTSYADGKPFHLWASYLLDPTQFAPADYDNQSAIFPLISKPGGITGLVGGEYGVVFKRNSVWRMTYVGLPPIFQFDLMIEGVGCSHPQSIVSAGGDVYFWGGGSIHRMGPNGYERLSGGRVEKYLFDTGYEDKGLYNRYGVDSRENDALVWGAYDAYSGLIWWLYRTLSDGQYNIDNAIVYSVIEDRFTTLNNNAIDLNLLLGQQNVVTNEPVLNRSVLGFRTTGTTIDQVKFLDDVTYEGTLKTKILTPSSWGYEPGRDAKITAIRPMYTSQPSSSEFGNTELPNYQITITGAQDPSLRIGVQTRVENRIRENRQGWIPVSPIEAEFWQFEVEYPELYRSTIKEFLGLQIMCTQRGDG